MPLLLADFIYSRDCKPNLRKNVDTTLKRALRLKNSLNLKALFRLIRGNSSWNKFRD